MGNNISSSKRTLADIKTFANCRPITDYELQGFRKTVRFQDLVSKTFPINVVTFVFLEILSPSTEGIRDVHVQAERRMSAEPTES